MVTASPLFNHPSGSVTAHVWPLSHTTLVFPVWSELKIEMCAVSDLGPRSAMCSCFADSQNSLGSAATAANVAEACGGGVGAWQAGAAGVTGAGTVAAVLA